MKIGEDDDYEDHWRDKNDDGGNNVDDLGHLKLSAMRFKIGN